MDGDSVLPRSKMIGGIMSHEYSERFDELIMAVIKVLFQLFSANDCWAITGSTNLAIRGAAIQPSDIDIITTRKAADRLALSTRHTLHLDFTPSSTETIQSYYAITTINNISIDFMADVAVLTRNGTWKRLDGWAESIEYIQTKVGLVPLTTLAFERKVHLLLGKKERVQKIDTLEMLLYNNSLGAG